MKFQIGKNGITDNVLLSLQNAFKNRKVVRVYVLRALSPSKDKVKEIADKLVSKLKGKYTYTLIGFAIILKKRSVLVR